MSDLNLGSLATPPEVPSICEAGTLLWLTASTVTCTTRAVATGTSPPTGLFLVVDGVETTASGATFTFYDPPQVTAINRIGEAAVASTFGPATGTHTLLFGRNGDCHRGHHHE